MREQLELRKYRIGLAIDFSKHKTMIEPSRDEDRIEFEDVYVAIARIKLE